MALVLTALLLYGGAFAFVRRLGRDGMSQTHFVHLAEAFLRGRLDVERDKAPSLTELVPSNGRHYVVYPPMPAMLLMPLVAVWGTRVRSWAFSITLAALCVGLTYGLLRRTGATRQVSTWATILFGFGTTFWYTSLPGSSWYLALVVGTLFLLLACLEAYGHKRPFLIGLLVGAAALSRLPIVLATPFFCYVAIHGERAVLRKLALLLSGVGLWMGLNMLRSYAVALRTYRG